MKLEKQITKKLNQRQNNKNYLESRKFMRDKFYIKLDGRWYSVNKLGDSVLDWKSVNLYDTCEYIDGRIGVIVYKDNDFFTVDFNPNDGQGYHRLQVFRGYEYNQWFKRIGKVIF